MGSRCALHWMRRTAAGKQLSEYWRWKTYYELSFAAGLDLRRALQSEGALEPSVAVYPPSLRVKWERLTGELIAAFDKGIQDELHAGNEAEER